MGRVGAARLRGGGLEKDEDASPHPKSKKQTPKAPARPWHWNQNGFHNNSPSHVRHARRRAYLPERAVPPVVPREEKYSPACTTHGLAMAFAGHEWGADGCRKEAWQRQWLQDS
ncbi:unnamed protein product [Prorocentrum cordatum]|uniref:Uncharacterized protein n=1 Tax=Prorocentrum cordatum TaxID=2364126 RepID=A0ABN9R6R3_9DINO|nr:unnamed protein product [Polarella glacialis]